MRKPLPAILTTLTIAGIVAAGVTLGVGAYALPIPVASSTPRASHPVVAESPTPPMASPATPIPIPIPTASFDPGQAELDALVDQCMADKGYTDEMAEWRKADFHQPVEQSSWYLAHTDEERNAFENALWGISGKVVNPTWQQMGCSGSVEEAMGGFASD
jgi:hypothetical protein